MLLAGDIGGTKVHLGLLEVGQGKIKLLESARYPTKDYSGIETVVEEFLKDTGARPTQGCLGAAGPVQGRQCHLTNLPWTVEAEELKNKFGFEKLLLVNDLVLLAASIPYLAPTDLAVVQRGSGESSQRKALVAPGTGLGQAFLMPEDSGFQRVWDTEGGQCDWAPTDFDEVELFQHLLRQTKRVSVEHILSGPGLQTLYSYYRDREAVSLYPEKLSAEEICRRGMEDVSGPCRASLDRFLSVLSSVCGNLALQVMARGGVYIGGGIAPKMEQAFFRESFLDAFQNKGAFRQFMQTIPVYLIKNVNAPLLGAAGLVMATEVGVAYQGESTRNN